MCSGLSPSLKSVDSVKNEHPRIFITNAITEKSYANLIISHRITSIVLDFVRV